MAKKTESKREKSATLKKPKHDTISKKEPRHIISIKPTDPGTTSDTSHMKSNITAREGSIEAGDEPSEIT